MGVGLGGEEVDSGGQGKPLLVWWVTEALLEVGRETYVFCWRSPLLAWC